jgi:hypothetical protein
MKNLMIYLSISVKDGRWYTMSIHIRFCDRGKREMNGMSRNDLPVDG